MTLRLAATIAGTLIGATVGTQGERKRTMRMLRPFGVTQCLHLEKS